METIPICIFVSKAFFEESFKKNKTCFSNDSLLIANV